MRRPHRLARLLLVWAVVTGAGSSLAPAHQAGPVRSRTAVEPELSAHPSLAVIQPAPDFSLLDSNGALVRRSDFRGRVVLLSFIYASCPTACPLISQRMALLQSRLRSRGSFPSRVALLSVTVDPERDSAAVLDRYAHGFSADPRGWRFLRESRERLAPVLAAYDEWTRSVASGEIEHPARLYLIDARGRVREIYSLALFDERQALLDIHALLREPS